LACDTCLCIDLFLAEYTTEASSSATTRKVRPATIAHHRKFATASQTQGQSVTRSLSTTREQMSVTTVQGTTSTTEGTATWRDLYTRDATGTPTPLATAQHGQSEVTKSNSTVTNSTSTYEVPHSSVVATVGSSIGLTCSSDVEITFRWLRRSVVNGQVSPVYNGKFHWKFLESGRFRVHNCGLRNCTLVIDDMRIDDAATYICTAGDVLKYWSLTVLGR